MPLKLKTYMQKYSIIIRSCSYQGEFLQEIHRFLGWGDITGLSNILPISGCFILITTSFGTTCGLIWCEDTHQDIKRNIAILLKGLLSLFKRCIWFPIWRRPALLSTYWFLVCLFLCNSGPWQYLYFLCTMTLSHCNPPIFQFCFH